MGEEKKPEKPKCVEQAANGVRCANDAREGSNYCEEHDPSLQAKKGGGGGGGGWGFGHGPVYSPRVD